LPQRRAADHLVGVGDLRLQCALHFGLVEARQNVDDMQPRNGILALQPPEQFRHCRLVGRLGDDAKQRRFLVRLLGIGRGQQLAHREALCAGR
jgi:hypothetical protein